MSRFSTTLTTDSGRGVYENEIFLGNGKTGKSLPGLQEGGELVGVELANHEPYLLTTGRADLGMISPLKSFWSTW
ncbi:MAG: hypothetical protein JWM16_4072 [Verrucomicrobiales bacterium]|nr:hypothetical protein [Verrucomicrobiales bacterium]